MARGRDQHTQTQADRPICSNDPHLCNDCWRCWPNIKQIKLIHFMLRSCERLKPDLENFMKFINWRYVA